MAMAQEKKVDATLTMSEGQVAVGIGFSWGKGVLTYQGKEYPFKVKGLSVVDIGITKATSAGKVYNLKKLEDFNGNYTAASAEGTLAGGAGALTMKNQNGVVIDLVSTTAGVNLKLSVEGVSLTLDK
jgi:plastocyanin domain-containing protein